jgi:uncharacterized membrane protein YkoI
MFETTKKTLVALGLIGAFAAGGATLAGAATKSKSSSADPASTTEQRPDRPAQTQLTGDTADKVKAAALAKVPGATVLRVESGGHNSAYHAHVRKSDGTEVVVLVNSSFEATAVETRPAGGRGGHRGHGGPGGPGGRGDHKAETALTGDTADKVTAAAKTKVPGGTVLRVENDSDSSSPYEAHVRKADGTEVVVLVNSSFEATSVKEHPQHP